MLNNILFRKYKFWIIKYFSCHISTYIFVTIITNNIIENNMDGMSLLFDQRLKEITQEHEMLLGRKNEPIKPGNLHAL